jgi:hypothetical protein
MPKRMNECNSVFAKYWSMQLIEASLSKILLEFLKIF